MDSVQRLRTLDLESNLPIDDVVEKSSEQSYHDDPEFISENLVLGTATQSIGIDTSGFTEPRSIENFLHLSPELLCTSSPLDAADQSRLSDDYLQHSQESTSGLTHINARNKIQVSDEFHQFISNEHIQSTNDPLKRFPFVLSSLGIESSDYTECSEENLREFPTTQGTSTTLLTGHPAQFCHDCFHHPSEHLATALTFGIADHSQFANESLQYYPGLMSTPTFLDPANQSQSDNGEDDITPLEYARNNGLSRDYLKEPYLVSNFDIFGEYMDGLTDDSNLPQFKLTAAVNTDERLTISKPAALLIAAVSHEETFEWIEYTMFQTIDTRKSKSRLRLDLPLLRSDHETDCKKFAQRDGFEINLKNVKLPLEMIDEENNAGLAFSSSLWNKGAEILEQLKKEKLEISKDTLVYLQSIIKNNWAEENENEIWSSVQMYKRNTALEPITPPLSLCSSPLQLCDLSMFDDAMELPILSDPESLTKYDLEAIEKRVFDEDVPTPIKSARISYHEFSDKFIGSDIVNVAGIYSQTTSIDNPSISPLSEIERLKRGDLKVEEPLTPIRPTEPPKAVRFNELVMEWPITSSSPSKDPFESSYFEEAFGDSHQSAIRMSEQEVLIAADTTARVEVPIMDFSLPSPPWKHMQNVSTASLLGIQKALIKEIIGPNLPKWAVNGHLKIRYYPFSNSFAKVSLEGSFVDDDSTWKAFVNNLEDDKVIDTSTLTWKPPGLRILRDRDDDDEIEASHSEKFVPQDISFLVRKRKMEIEDRRSGEVLEISNAPTNIIARQQPRKKPKPVRRMPAETGLQKDNLNEGVGILLGGAFSVGNSIENFLELRGMKKPKLGDSLYFAKASGKALPASPQSATQPELLMQLPIRDSPVPEANPPLPAPTIIIVNKAVNVIIASTLLKHRSLIKHVEALLPQIHLVERDLSAHNTTAWMPNSVTRSPITSPLASEADIIVSPSVGIVITTLQKIKQKPLPGQRTKPAIRERLENVSSRFEKLIVLVTESRQDETTRELDESDCKALSEFIGFSLGLQTTINVQFVGCGEAILAKWLVNAIVQYRREQDLLDDETHWELFLRRAGMNAFAAQYIIGVLKAPEGVDLLSSNNATLFGLSAFVNMGKEHRISRFGPVCGNRLMARVSAVVDARWS